MQPFVALRRSAAVSMFRRPLSAKVRGRCEGASDQRRSGSALLHEAVNLRAEASLSAEM